MKKPYKPRFANFGEYLYWSYANFQMLCYALNQGVRRYDQSCYMIRAKAYKAYKEGRWNIHGLFENNVAKIRAGDYCWYCGREVSDKAELTADHVFPRSKGGGNDMDNIIMVCRSCNSSKRDTDLFEWYAETRKEWPPLGVLGHYLKQIYLYSKDNGLLEKHRPEMDGMALPFNHNYIPLEFPQPEFYMSELE